MVDADLPYPAPPSGGMSDRGPPAPSAEADGHGGGEPAGGAPETAAPAKVVEAAEAAIAAEPAEAAAAPSVLVSGLEPAQSPEHADPGASEAVATAPAEAPATANAEVGLPAIASGPADVASAGASLAVASLLDAPPPSTVAPAPVSTVGPVATLVREEKAVLVRENARLHGEVAELDEKLVAMQADLDAAAQALRHQAEAANARESALKQQLKQLMEAAKGDEGEFMEALQAKTRHAARLEEQVAEARAAAREAQAQTEEARAELRAAQHAVESAERREQLAKEEAARLRDELGKATDEVSTRTLSLGRDHQRALEALRAEVLDAEAALAASREEAASQQRVWAARERGFQDEVSRLSSALAEARRRLEDQTSVHDSHHGEAEASQAELALARDQAAAAEAALALERGRAQALSREVRALTEELDAARRQHHEAERRLAAQLEERAAECARLREEITAERGGAKFDATVSALEERISALTSRLLQKQEAMDALATEKAALASRLASTEARLQQAEVAAHRGGEEEDDHDEDEDEEDDYELAESSGTASGGAASRRGQAAGERSSPSAVDLEAGAGSANPPSFASPQRHAVGRGADLAILPGASTGLRAPRTGSPDGGRRRSGWGGWGRSSSASKVPRRYAMSRLPQIAKYRQVAKAVDRLDRVLLSTGRFLWHTPAARALFLLYVLVLHAWVFYILAFHTHHLNADGGPTPSAAFPGSSIPAPAVAAAPGLLAAAAAARARAGQRELGAASLTPQPAAAPADQPSESDAELRLRRDLSAYAPYRVDGRRGAPRAPERVAERLADAWEAEDVRDLSAVLGRLESKRAPL